MQSLLLLLIFINSCHSIDIGCIYSNTSNWNVIGFAYTCSITSMDFSTNSTHIKNVNGTHLTGLSNNDVKMVYIHINDCPRFNLTILPKGFINFFPNILGFRFDACNIETLYGNELLDYPNLVRFSILSSSLERISGNLFEPTPNVRWIDFIQNKIRRIGEGLLKNVERASFNNNTCIHRSAANLSQMPALIKEISLNCVDRCFGGDVRDYACELNNKIEGLNEVDDLFKEEMLTLKEENKRLNDEIKELKQMMQDQNQILQDQNAKLQDQASKLETQNFKLEIQALKLENQGLKLESHAALISSQGQIIDSHSVKLEGHESKLETHADLLQELEAKIIELTSRPCSC